MDSILTSNSVFNTMESDSVGVYSLKGKQHLLLEDRYRVIESLSIVDFEFDRYSIYGNINYLRCLCLLRHFRWTRRKSLFRVRNGEHTHEHCARSLFSFWKCRASN